MTFLMNYRFLRTLIFQVSQCLHFHFRDIVLYVVCLPDKLCQVDLNLASTEEGMRNESNLEASDLLSIFCLYGSRLFSRFYTALWKLKYSLLHAGSVDIGSIMRNDVFCNVVRREKTRWGGGHKNCNNSYSATPTIILTFVLLQGQNQHLQKNSHTFFCSQCVVSLIIIRNNSDS